MRWMVDFIIWWAKEAIMISLDTFQAIQCVYVQNYYVETY